MSKILLISDGMPAEMCGFFTSAINKTDNTAEWTGRIVDKGGTKRFIKSDLA